MIRHFQLARPHSHALLELIVEPLDDRLRLAQFDVLRTESPDFEPALQHRQDRLELERLLDVIERARLHRFHGRVDRAVAGHHDAAEVRVDFARRGEQRDAIHAGHLQVGEEQIEALARQRTERFLR